jgi:hypothetical protein
MAALALGDRLATMRSGALETDEVVEPGLV